MWREWRVIIRGLSALELVYIISTHILLARALQPGHLLWKRGLGNIIYLHAQDKEGPGFVEHIAVSVILPKTVTPSVLVNFWLKNHTFSFLVGRGGFYFCLFLCFSFKKTSEEIFDSS